jgi:hypothetical protein
MDPVTLAAIIGAIATIGAAVIAKNWGEKKGEERGEKKGADAEREAWVQTLTSAPKKYAERLSDLIDKANSAPNPEVLAHARAIVSARNDLRETLTSLSSLLNSEIDRLSTEVEDASDSGTNVEPLRSTVQVLKLKWPAKRDQVEVELRKLIAELGLERRAGRR